MRHLQLQQPHVERARSVCKGIGRLAGQLINSATFPDCSRKDWISQRQEFYGVLVVRLFFLPAACLEANLQVRKRGCKTPSSEFGAARGVTSSSSFSSFSLKYFRTEESPCTWMHKPGILQLLKTLQLPDWFAGKKKRKKKDKATMN